MTRARVVPATTSLPEHCQVLGSIAARSVGADPIRFQLNLPLQWNQNNGFVNLVKPQYAGGTLSAGKTRLIATAVNSACDALDGLADGVINNYLACPARFDVQALRCPGGADVADTCLSDAQLSTFNAAYGPTKLAFALANGLTTYPGRLFGGEIQPNEGIERWVSSGKALGFEPVASDARAVIYGIGYARNVIARDPAFDVRQFDAARFAARIQQVSALMDATDPNLRAFFTRGGKLIIRENSGDMAQSPAAGMQYYESVAARMGQATVDAFARLYVSPAASHGGPAVSLTTNTPVPTSFDMLATLDQRVTGAVAPPDLLVQVRNDGVAPFATIASRPMCRYPNYPHFVSGDPLKAESYRCVASVR